MWFLKHIYSFLGAWVACLLQIREKLAPKIGKTPTENEDEVMDDILDELADDALDATISTVTTMIKK